MKEKLKNMLTFSRPEQRGTMLLIILTLILSGGLTFIPRWVKQNPSGHEQFEERFNQWKDLLMTEPEVEGNLSKGDFEVIRMFPFDPNEATAEELQQLGIDRRIASRWTRYREGGGIFRKPGDILRIYGLDTATFLRLEPYIVISHNYTYLSRSNAKKPAPVNIIELNTATDAQLQSLKGIGPVFSRRILKYRDLLGGYKDPLQLSEVYGLTDSLLFNIMPYISADTTAIKKINLKEADYRSLVRHPYLDQYYTRAILNYIKINKGIESVDELMLNNVLPDTLFRKVSIYLQINYK